MARGCVESDTGLEFGPSSYTIRVYDDRLPDGETVLPYDQFAALASVGLGNPPEYTSKCDQKDLDRAGIVNDPNNKTLDILVDKGLVTRNPAKGPLSDYALTEVAKDATYRATADEHIKILGLPLYNWA